MTLQLHGIPHTYHGGSLSKGMTTPIMRHTPWLEYCKKVNCCTHQLAYTHNERTCMQQINVLKDVNKPTTRLVDTHVVWRHVTWMAKHNPVSLWRNLKTPVPILTLRIISKTPTNRSSQAEPVIVPKLGHMWFYVFCYKLDKIYSLSISHRWSECTQRLILVAATIPHPSNASGSAISVESR